MRSFILSVFATLAFGLFCSAAPTSSPDVVVAARADVRVRDESPLSLQTILTGACSDLSPYTDKIKSLDASTCTVDDLTLIFSGVKGVLAEVVVDLKGLVGADIDDILACDTGLLDVDGLAQLLSELLHVVFGILAVVLDVTVTVKGGIWSLVVDIVTLVASLLTCVLGLVSSVLNGLISVLVGLIGDIIPCIRTLNIQVLIKVLCL